MKPPIRAGWRDLGVIGSQRRVAALHAAQAEVLPPDQRLVDELQVRKAAQQRRNEISASSRASGAPKQKWAAHPKARCRLSGRSKSSRSGSGKRSGSRLPARHDSDHGLTLPDLLAAELDVVASDARGVLAGALVAEQLLDRGGMTRRLGAQALHAAGCAAG